MLYVPLVVGAFVAPAFSWRMAWLALSVTFLFISRESLLAWWRGRSRGQAQKEARRMMLVYLALAAVTGAPLVFFYHLFWLVLLAAVTGGLLFFNAQQTTRREDRTVAGEILAILGLTLTAPTAYYVASGAIGRTALWLWAVCALYFTSSVFYVKLRVYSLNRRKSEAGRHSWRLCALYHSFLLGALIVSAISGSLNLLVFVAFAPALARAFWQMAKPAERLNLRQIGVAEIAYSLVFLIFITMTFRIA